MHGLTEDMALLCATKDWPLVCLLVYLSTFKTSLCQQSENCSQESHGDIRVIGINTTDGVAGHMELCFDGLWRAVCQNGWNLNDAIVVCRQLGFTPDSGAQAQACNESCLGSSDLSTGIRSFTCNGTESALINCNRAITNLNGCGHTAGIACYKNHSQSDGKMSQEIQTTCPPPKQSDCTCPSAEVSLPEHPPTRTENMADTEGGREKQHRSPCTVLAGGLGTLAGVLALILVGVVLRWAWHCCRSKVDSKRDTTTELGLKTLPNTSYATTSLYHPPRSQEDSLTPTDIYEVVV